MLPAADEFNPLPDDGSAHDSAPLGPPHAPLTPAEAPAPSSAACYPPPIGPGRHLDEAELSRSLEATLADWQRLGCADLWLFGYGSLIWRPDMSFDERVCARVHGYHRGLYLWSRVNRGTGAEPGLVLALDRGGSCPGVAFRLAREHMAAEFPALWRREMAMGSYRPAWLPCSLGDGRRVTALAFVIRRDAPTYAGRLPDEMVRIVFARASGRYGTTLDYVARTCEALRDSGMPDHALEARLARCRGD